MEYAYKRIGAKGFRETIEAVERSVGLHGFVVQEMHDIQERLVAKGFPIRPLVIFEIAPAEERGEPGLSLLMPCRIHVYEEGPDVIVAAIRPTLFAAVFPEHGLDGLAEEIEQVVVKVVDSAVS